MKSPKMRRLLIGMMVASKGQLIKPGKKMNLLPVIYASLLIFASLFLIVLVTSYITYKVKQHNTMALAGANGHRVTKKNNSAGQNQIKFQKSNERSADIRDSDQVSRTHSTNRIVNKEVAHKIAGQNNFVRNDKHVVVKNSHSSRMIRIQDLRSGSNISRPKNEFNNTPTVDHKRVSNGSILRYYEDF